MKGLLVLTFVLVMGCVYSQVTPVEWFNPCDFNQNGVVDEDDYWAFMFAYESSLGDKNYFGAFDLNEDGYIDIEDFSIFAACYPLPLGVKDRMSLTYMKPVTAVYDSQGKLVGEPLTTGWYIVVFGDETKKLTYVQPGE